MDIEQQNHLQPKDAEGKVRVARSALDRVQDYGVTHQLAAHRSARNSIIHNLNAALFQRLILH